MHMNKIPSFTDVQRLLLHYSTLKSDKNLYELFYSIFPNFLEDNQDRKSIRQVYNEFLLKYYPNETCIKSSFINQILMKGKSHVTIFELPVGSSRADLCKINGKSIAYEIKTDYDNFNRLDKQLKDYSNIFEYTYLICSSKNLENVIHNLPENCGIYTYYFTRNKNIKFKLIRNAILSDQIIARKQLEIFSKKEITNYFKLANTASRSDMLTYIYDTYSTTEINKKFKQMLKSRYSKQWSFIIENHDKIYEIDYQWFYKSQIAPEIIYNN